MKNLIRSEFYNKCGIYELKSTFDDRLYIGSSSNLYKRINDHISQLRKNKHSNSKLQNFFNKYGEKSLAINIVEILSDNSTLLERELYYIKKIKTELLFNLEMNPVEPNRAPATEEAKINMRKAWADNYDEMKSIVSKNLILARKNQVKPDGSIWKGRKHKESSKLKMSKSAKSRGYVSGLNIPVYMYDKNGYYLSEFNSANEAATKILGNSNLSSNILRRNSAGGYLWRKYKKDRIKLKYELYNEKESEMFNNSGEIAEFLNMSYNSGSAILRNFIKNNEYKGYNLRVSSNKIP